MAGCVTEYLAHPGLRLGCVLLMHQAAMLDGFALDALTLQQDGLSPAEIDISRGQVVQAFMVALVTCPPEMFPIFGRVCFLRGRTNETQQVQR